MVLFMNAISDNPFYNEHYSDVRLNWGPKLGAQGLHLIHEVSRAMSMSRLCSDLSLYEVRTLDDILSLLEDVPKRSNGEHHIVEHAELLADCFRMLKHAGLPAAWNQRVQPYL